MKEESTFVPKKQGDIDSYGNVIDWDTERDKKEGYIGEDTKIKNDDENQSED